MSLLALTLLLPTALAAMGPYFSTGPVATTSFIRTANSTLILPSTPTGGNNGITSLWVGMGTSNGDLIQSIADHWEGDSWVLYAYTLVKTGEYSQMPVQSPEQGESGEDGRVNFLYEYDDASGNYTQTLSLNGRVVSTLSTLSDFAQGFGSAVECAEDNCGTVGAHTWVDTTIELDEADEEYTRTFGKASGVTGDLITADGGKTWTATTMSIPAFTFGQT